jgi:anaerobic magnesium-protoporphyrin IX monomethyl ester cyclase
MIVLVNPYISSAERYGRDIGDIGGHQMPLGIYYLASFLEKEGRAVTVLDAEALDLPHEEAVRVIAAHRPRIVGFTATTVGFRNARALARLVTDALPEAALVIGGPHMTAMPEETMAAGPFAYGIVQEGEVAFAALCRHILDSEGDLESLPNLYRLQEGKVVSSPERVRVDDLDTIPPPARHLCRDLSLYRPPVGAYRRKPVANVITSRGCPYKCIFCDNNTFGRKVRYFSAEYVAREVEALATDFGVREIAFLDDTFVLDKKRLREIFRLLRERGVRFPWTCMTRVNNLDFETLKMMKENGCWQIRIGIESGSQEVLDFIRKGITLEQVDRVTSWCRDLGVRCTGFFILGHHIDTPETIQETIEYGLRIPLSDIVVTINTPIPGTESYRLVRDYGEYVEHDWMDLNYWTPVFIPTGLTREFMLDKQKEFYRRFYGRPRVLAGQLGKIRDFQGLRIYARNALLGLKFIGKDASDT